MNKKQKEYKGVRDEIKEQQLKTKDMTFKEKLSYFWDYYRVHTFVGIIAIIAVTSFIYQLYTSKDFAFYSILLNSYQLSGTELSQSFGEYAEIDLEEYDCFIDTSTTLSYGSMDQYDMATSQKMVALMQTQDLDCTIFDFEVFESFSFNEMFIDLRTVYSAEELAAYEDHLYYIDYALIRAEEERDDFEEAADYDDTPRTPEETAEALESHRYPDQMQEPIPVGIFVADSPFISQTDCYPGLEPIFGMIATSQRFETSKKFLEYMWDDTIDFINIIEEPYT